MGSSSRVSSGSSTAVVVCVAMFGTASLGCAAGEETRARKCERLREHVVELRVDGLPERDRNAHRLALRQALAGQFSDDCMSFTSRQLSCALAAADVVAATACASESSR